MIIEKKNGGNQSEVEFLSEYNPNDFDRLSVTVDTVLFSIDTRPETENFRKRDEQKMTVLLVKRDAHPYLDKWSLPGGFVGLKESLEMAARRVLHEKTGLDDLYLEQLFTFGDPERDPRMRIISCAYLSLIDRSKYNHIQSESGLLSEWFELEFAEGSDSILLKSNDRTVAVAVKSVSVQNGMIETQTYQVTDGSCFAFDHAKLILEGLLRLRGKIQYTDIVFNLMPETFTIPDLQEIYEIILGHKLLMPQFRRDIALKVIGTDMFTGDKGHRPSRLYKYKRGGSN